MMLVCSSVSPHAIDDDARAAAQLHELAERAARRNIRVGYEALAWASRVNHYEHAWKIVREADHPHLGVILDSFHILSLATRRRRSPISRATRSSSCRWPMRPGCRWTCCSGAAITAISRGRVSSTCRAFSSRCWSPATRARCRSRSSTTSSARRRTARSPSMRCARCSTWRSRRACAWKARPPTARAPPTSARAPCTGSSSSIRRRRRPLPASHSSSSPWTRRPNGCSTTCSRRSASGARVGTARRTSRCTGKARST